MCNSVVNVLVIGSVLGQSLMIISTTGILLYAKVSPLYGSALLLFTNILTGHFTLGHLTLLMYKISDLYLLQFLRYWDSN